MNSASDIFEKALNGKWDEVYVYNLLSSPSNKAVQAHLTVERDEQRNTLLHIAVKQGDINAVNMLIAGIAPSAKYVRSTEGPESLRVENTVLDGDAEFRLSHLVISSLSQLREEVCTWPELWKRKIDNRNADGETALSIAIARTSLKLQRLC